MKPQSISCACHARPPSGWLIHWGAKIQMNREISAQPQPAIYSGLKPRLRNAFMSGRLAAACLPSWICCNSAMGDLRRHAIGFIVHLVSEPQTARNALRELLGTLGEGTVRQFLRCIVKKRQPLGEHVCSQAGRGDMFWHGWAAVGASAQQQ